MKMLIKNGFLSTEGKEQPVDILIESGIITKIGHNIEAAGPVIDAEGKLILPGLIDMSCDICEPGYENKEDMRSVSKTASKGGFTSIACRPSTNPVIDNKTAANFVITRSRKVALVNIFVCGSVTKGLLGQEIAEIGEMVRSGVVAVSDGGRSVSSALLMRNIMLYAKMFDVPVICTCEDETLASGGVVNSGKISASHGLNPVPREAEEIVVARNIILALHTGAKVHIAGITTAGSVEQIRFAKKRGVDITCETSPHYFTLTEDDASGFNTLAKLRPPLRCQKDVEAIIEGLKDGTIDVISSGHSPETADSKNMEFDMASTGISSLETAFPLSYAALVETGIMTLPQLLEKFCTNPAQILNLSDKAHIAEGYDGDLFIFDKESRFIIDPSKFASKAKYSPYAGQEIKGKVLYTVVGGNLVYLT